MLEARTSITAGGRVVIPSEIRKKLNLNIGDEVIMRVESGEVRISSLKQAVKDVQDIVSRHNKKKISLKDMLLKQRREESDNEE